MQVIQLNMNMKFPYNPCILLSLFLTARTALLVFIYETYYWQCTERLLHLIASKFCISVRCKTIKCKTRQ